MYIRLVLMLHHSLFHHQLYLQLFLSRKQFVFVVFNGEMNFNLLEYHLHPSLLLHHGSLLSFSSFFEVQEHLRHHHLLLQQQLLLLDQHLHFLDSKLNYLDKINKYRKQSLLQMIQQQKRHFYFFFL